MVGVPPSPLEGASPLEAAPCRGGLRNWLAWCGQEAESTGWDLAPTCCRAGKNQQKAIPGLGDRHEEPTGVKARAKLGGAA